MTRTTGVMAGVGIECFKVELRQSLAFWVDIARNLLIVVKSCPVLSARVYWLAIGQTRSGWFWDRRLVLDGVVGRILVFSVSIEAAFSFKFA